MILIMKEIQELFCETEEQVEEILESAKNDSRELIGKEVKKRVKKFKDVNGDRVEVEYYHVRLTYQISTVNSIMEDYYGM